MITELTPVTRPDTTLKIAPAGDLLTTLLTLKKDCGGGCNEVWYVDLLPAESRMLANNLKLLADNIDALYVRDGDKAAEAQKELEKGESK